MIVSETLEEVREGRGWDKKWMWCPSDWDRRYFVSRDGIMWVCTDCGEIVKIGEKNVKNQPVGG